MYSCIMGGDRIIRHIYGNISGREAEWCSTSAWGVDAKGQRTFWDSSKEFSKPTAMSLTRAWAGRSWCTPDVGRIIWTPELSRANAWEVRRTGRLVRGRRDNS